MTPKTVTVTVKIRTGHYSVREVLDKLPAFMSVVEGSAEGTLGKPGRPAVVTAVQTVK